MDKSGTADEQHQALKRIAALLLALAGLADRLTDQPHAIRRLVLWILRPAEAAACEYIWTVTPPADRLAARESDGPGDAARLARHLRMLAAAYNRLSQRAGLFARRHPCVAESLRRGWLSGLDAMVRGAGVIAALALAFVQPVTALDTS